MRGDNANVQVRYGDRILGTYRLSGLVARRFGEERDGAGRAGLDRISGYVPVAWALTIAVIMAWASWTTFPLGQALRPGGWQTASRPRPSR